MTDHTALLEKLKQQYLEAYPAAGAEQQRALGSQIRGGSHQLRLFEPAPFRVARASGAYLEDPDGNRILDFWQGHYANILGHNPGLVTTALAERLGEGRGLQTGLSDTLECALAERLQQTTGAERVRFTTSGTLATMYAVMLARAFTGRELLVKVGGGWHGGHPYLLKGVGWHDGYQSPDSSGLLPGEADRVLITRYNDLQRLEDIFSQHGDRIAAFIVEPWMGSGGFMGADPLFLETARRLTGQHGALLIFDEIISGFRFCAGSVARLYGIQPDLAAYAKVLGGGMPLATLAGRADVMALCDPASPRRVKFDGGTFSGHHLALLAALTMVEYLIEHEETLYPALGAAGERYRREAEAAFEEAGIRVRCTGDPVGPVKSSSLGMVHFPRDPDLPLDAPDQVWNPERCDVVMREQVFKLALLLEGVHVMHGFGAVSAAHTEEDIAIWRRACEGAAARLREDV